MTDDEGYIKFRCEHRPGLIVEKKHVEDLLVVREKLFEAKLIGQDDNGVAYGNISKRMIGSDRFYITGTQTGGIERLGPEHIALILEADLRKNELRCSGAIKASSESLTHWALYEVGHSINAVIHVHHAALWQCLMDEGMPTTTRLVLYGTPQMGRAVQQLYRKEGSCADGILAMGGHESGVLSYGTSLGEAYEVLMSWYGRIGR